MATSVEPEYSSATSRTDADSDVEKVEIDEIEVTSTHILVFFTDEDDDDNDVVVDEVERTSTRCS